MDIFLPNNVIQSQEDYVRIILARHCMPTLLQLKPSSLITVTMDPMNLTNLALPWNKGLFLNSLKIELEEFEAEYTILYENRDRMDILIMNPRMLFKTLTMKEICVFLSDKGYCLNSDSPIDDVLMTLRLRLKEYHSRRNTKFEKAVFPHEIGVILGYPLDDVEAFIRYQGRNYVINGFWKVYYNYTEAIRTFTLYQELRQRAKCLLADGKNLKDINI